MVDKCSFIWNKEFFGAIDIVEMQYVASLFLSYGLQFLSITGRCEGCLSSFFEYINSRVVFAMHAGRGMSYCVQR